jgi:formylglycine-generating enzyme required for sulfatase activity
MSSFRMGATPVTWGMWKEYCEATNSSLPDDPGWGYPDGHPVVKVSWEDTMNPGGFCDWATGVAGFTLTLPTEAQWEYSARGLKDDLEYPWGNDFDREKLWCDADATAAVDRTNRIYRNSYDLTDMVGNVWQWCADDYNEDYRPFGKDPVDTRKSPFRCVRGGQWNFTYQDYFRCAYRDWDFPDHSYNYIGFRLSAGPK